MTSFAKSISPTPITADSPRPDFDKARQIEPEKAAGRASEMVKKERPQPALKPSPMLSHGPDAAAFNKNWEDEARAARREAFKAQRREQAAKTRRRSFNRAVTR